MTGSKERRETSVTPSDAKPSRWTLRLIVVLLAAIDFALASHMALYQWRVIDSVWDPVFGCAQSQLVLDSAVSEWFRRTFLVPDAAAGAAAYLAEIVLGLAGSQHRWRERPWLVVLFGINAAAVAVAGVALIVLQPTVVGAWCLPCLITAVLSLAMLALALPEVKASVNHLRQVRSGGRKSKMTEANE